MTINKSIQKRIHYFDTIRRRILKELGISIKKYNSILKNIAEQNNSYLTELDKLITRPLFALAKDYDDIVALYTMFVRGTLPTHPTHGGPLNLDSQTQIIQLETINGKFKCITVDGQPGICNKNEKQRGYIILLMPANTPLFYNLISILEQNKKVLFNINSQYLKRAEIAEKTKDWPIVK